MTTKIFLAGALLAAVALQAGAGSIYRCTGPGGVTYQETACAGEDIGGVANIPTSYPNFNVIERDRLLQREAMLDDRLLKRAQIESAERIARDDRAAREKEAEARIAEAEASQSYGYGVPLFAANRNNLRNRPHAHHPIARPPRSL
jgi:hypothetical protein